MAQGSVMTRVKRPASANVLDAVSPVIVRLYEQTYRVATGEPDFLNVLFALILIPGVLCVDRIRRMY